MGESLRVDLEPSQAVAQRDTLAKLLYKNTFEYLVSKINLNLGIKQTK